jgi:hypothetical protein
MKPLGWLYWSLHQVVALVYKLLGFPLIAILAAFRAWHTRPSSAAMFAGRTVVAWLPLPMSLLAPLPGLLLGAHFGPVWAVVGAVLGILAALLEVFDNEEDGVVPPALVNGKPYLEGVDDRLRAFAWSAWRNSANGLRWLPGAACYLDARLVVTPKPWGYVASCGWRPCVQWHRLRIGWLVNQDARPGYRSWPVLELV